MISGTLFCYMCYSFCDTQQAGWDLFISSTIFGRSEGFDDLIDDTDDKDPGALG